MEDGFTTAYVLYIHIEKRDHVIVGGEIQPLFKNKFVFKMRALQPDSSCSAKHVSNEP